MDLGNSIGKTQEAETEILTRIQPAKPSPFSNGVLKRHASLHLHHPVVVTYKECLKNHAASLGGHAVDGCGEFMPSPTSNPAEPTSLKCAACGCHRNFHRREPEELTPPPLPNATPALEYQPHHRHHPPHPPPPPPPRGNSSSSPNNSPSPPPISSSYYPSAPHMLLSLSHDLSGPPTDNKTPISNSAAVNTTSTPILSSSSRKRFRTKFTQYQKEKMLELSERVGWKMQRRDEDVINNFCNEIGVDRGVFKVWMHNNKHTFGKKDHPPLETTFNGGGMNYSAIGGGGGGVSAYHRQHGGDSTDIKQNVHVQERGQHRHFHESTTAQAFGTNGSSSS